MTARQEPKDLYAEIDARGRAAIRAGAVQCDPWLRRPQGEDTRMALALLLRPAPAVQPALLRAEARLQAAAPAQYYYPAAQQHLTVLDLRAGRPGYVCTPAEAERYRAVLAPVCAGIQPFPLEFTGLAVSENAVLAKGYYAPGGLDALRAAVRAALRKSGLPLEERYETRSAHITAVRFARPLADPSALLAALDAERSRPFGRFVVHTVQLVCHDWYDARGTLLAELPLGGEAVKQSKLSG